MKISASGQYSGQDTTMEWKKVMKKPIPVGACQINEEFEVDTLEGTMKGKKGDWLMKGIDGEFYPCDREIFEKTYDILEDE